MAYFAAFLNRAYKHFSDTIKEPFSFIKSSRTYNPVAVDLDKHLSNFLKHVKSPNALISFIAPIIALSFVLNNYPPNAYYT